MWRRGGWLLQELKSLSAPRIRVNHIRTVSASPSYSSASQSAQDYSDDQVITTYSGLTTAAVGNNQIGQNVSKKDKIKFIVNTLLELNDSKEAIYGALDAWVAFQQKFPIAAIKNVLLALEKQQQWHRIVQVIKWMLSKGQGNTMGTYGQLIRALDMDHRVEEAHKFWEKKVGMDLHSVPWDLCKQMIGIYYRNNMLENLVKLFRGLEAFDRKPPDKSVVQRVVDACEILGLLEEKNRLLEKYHYLFSETGEGEPRKSKKAFPKKTKSGALEGRKQALASKSTSVTAVENNGC